jgi:hypothetical protein
VILVRYTECVDAEAIKRIVTDAYKELEEAQNAYDAFH